MSKYKARFQFQVHLAFWHFLAIVILIGIMTIGCAQIKHYTPQSHQRSYIFQNLPYVSVEIRVKDFRVEKSKFGNLADIIQSQISSSLSQESSQVGKYVIQIEIIEHRSFSTLGNWNAVTRFRIKLFDKHETLIGQWEAKGKARRSNMWGYFTAEAVAQDSYDIAIADTYSILSGIKLQ